jgi:hypothetical protein
LETVDQQPTATLDTGEAAPQALPGADTFRELERQPTIASEEIPEEEPGRVTRLPTAELSREPASLAPPLEPENVDFKPPVTRMATEPEEQIHSPPPDRERRQSAAPGIVAPAEGAPQGETKPGVPRHKHRKVASVPPDQQYPPVPAYPVRETPAWVRPDVYTPPPKPKPEVKPKEKRGVFGRGSKPRDEVQPEPFRERPKVEPFRTAAPGKPHPSVNIFYMMGEYIALLLFQLYTDTVCRTGTRKCSWGNATKAKKLPTTWI